MHKYLVFVVALSFMISCQTADPEKYARTPAIQKRPVVDLAATSLGIVEKKEELVVEHYFVSLKTRPLVFQNFLLIKPRNPVASVILFAGGAGTLGLKESSGTLLIYKYQYNFLIRTRNDFADYGFIVAAVDAPSDRISLGMHDGFRNSGKHLRDIEAVISFLKNEAKVPVWLIGTSRGTESAAYIASKAKGVINGLILTSSMTVYNRRGSTVTSLSLDRIDVPTLIVSHEKDGCEFTPPSGAQQIARRLINAPKVEVKYFRGGYFPASGPCDAMSAHGFYGIEKEVVAYIADFIKTNSELSY
jgi:pimeloyl-ACP methyl ester carboxylesterase